MKIPYAKVPRFIELPTHEGKHYIMFIDDIIRANLSSIFPGYVVESCYSIKISRDADIYLDDEKGGNIVENIRKKVKKRKIGALSRFMYDSNMPDDFLAFICNAFGITTDDLVLGGRYNNLQDLIKLPNPRGKELEQQCDNFLKQMDSGDGSVDIDNMVINGSKYSDGEIWLSINCTDF